MKHHLDFKSMIESVVCPIYKRPPKVIIHEDNSITLECCCQAFKVQCFYLIGKFLGDQTIEEAVAQWKKDNPRA